MEKFNEVEGNLIVKALKGDFDVVVHGCNCFCTMGAGIAPHMAKNFGCDVFPLEHEDYRGDINKLGQIDYDVTLLTSGKPLIAVNAYTQYGFGDKYTEGSSQPLNYYALALCLQKLNKTFKGKHIGMPLIGCGLAGGNWEVVKELIIKNMPDVTVTIVHFK